VAIAPPTRATGIGVYHRAVTSARRSSILLVVALVAILLVPPGSAAAEPAVERAKPKWVARIQELVGDRPMSVAIGNDGAWWFRHRAWVRRPPASNEKLLLSMALFDRFEPGRRIPTRVMTAAARAGGTIEGSVWLVGNGDPEIRASHLGRLARQLVDAGIRRIRGSIRGATGPFARDWWATGWRDYFPGRYIALPTALTFNGNRDASGRHVRDPERRAATALTAKLRHLGVRVTGDPGAGTPPTGMRTLAATPSAPLRAIVRRMNVSSRNFAAEVLGKYLGARTYGRGSIANGARAIRSFVASHGLAFETYDGSGLSYANRATTLGTVQLLWVAQDHPWGEILRTTLPRGDQGTLKDRLRDVRVRAKTGTLERVSALSGWVWLQRSGEWAEFSIMSSGMATTTAKQIENQIVRVVSVNASDPNAG
jgi:serine-type D-Ala-D-Ala carboxypeptidase/endopeptidase (penicillin-binding protein 4)